MKRYKSKVERKYGENLQIKGERSLSPKAAFRRRPFAPGLQGKKKFRRKLSEYGRQLGEKQKLRRLDNVVMRLGIAESRAQARQIVNHTHILVNGKRNNIPSYTVKKGDVISIKKRFKESVFLKDIQLKLKNYTAPSWITLDKAKLEAKINSYPEKEELKTNVDLPQVIEYYSR